MNTLSPTSPPTLPRSHALPKRLRPAFQWILLFALTLGQSMLRAQGPSVPLIDSFAQLQQRVARIWTNNTFAILHPPGAEYQVQTGLLAFSPAFQPTLNALFPVLPEPMEGFRLFSLEVEETTEIPFRRLWATTAGTVTNTAPPLEYDSTGWVMENHAPPAFLSAPERVAWVNGWRLSGRQRVRCLLIAVEELPQYLAVQSNRAANAIATIATNELGVVSITTRPGGEHAEILLHVPPEVDRVALYQAASLAPLPTQWSLEGEIPHLTDPITYLHPLQKSGQLLMFANHVRDADGDGLPDAMEGLLFQSSTNRWDTDGDGLSDYQEAIIYRTSAIDWDSDGDGLDDALEIQGGYNPNQVNTGLTALDYARLQGVPPMELEVEAMFPSPFGLFTVFGSHTLAGTEPNRGPVRVAPVAQQPAHEPNTTYASTEGLGGSSDVQVDFRMVAHEEEAVIGGYVYCNPFSFNLKNGRIKGLEIIDQQEAEVTLDESERYDDFLGRVSMGGWSCFVGANPVSGEAKIRATVEPALYDLVGVTPSNVVMKAGGLPVTFTAEISKPFPYYDDYQGPMTWEIVPNLEDGAAFSSNAKTMFSSLGGDLAVAVEPGLVGREYILRASIPGRAPIELSLAVLKVDLVPEPGKVHHGFDPPNPWEGDPPDEPHWASVVQGATNTIVNLEITPAALAGQIDCRIVAGDEAYVDVEPKVYSAARTALQIAGKINNTTNIHNVSIHFVFRPTGEVIKILRVMILPEWSLEAGLYSLHDPASAGTQMNGLPSWHDCILVCNDVFKQAGIRFTLHGSSGARTYPYDTRGFSAVHAGYDAALPLRTPDGVMTLDEKDGLSKIFYLFGSVAYLPPTPMLFECATLSNTVSMVVVNAGEESYTGSGPPFIRGESDRPGIVYAKNLVNSEQLMLAIAHEIGHSLSLSRAGQDGHDARPRAQAVANDMPHGVPGVKPGPAHGGTLHLEEPAKAIMAPGSPVGGKLPWFHGRWLRHEDWRAANEAAGRMLNE